MKKNLIISLKKLLKVFGGEDIDNNNIINKIFDSIEEGSRKMTPLLLLQELN